MTPQPRSKRWLEPGGTRDGFLKAMAMEEDGVPSYNNAALECGANADAASKQIFERLVNDEEGGFAEYEKQRDNVKRLGCRYLALQSFGGEESAGAAASGEETGPTRGGCAAVR